MGIGLHGDFIGFSFNGIHSSELGITRVSDGSRYNDNLLPTSQDKTAVIPGGDGTYYWETNYTQKPFNINIAFDDLSEEQYKNLRQVFSTKKLGKLIFDETDYKYYMAKPTGTPQLKTICFDGEDSESNPTRIYKGEGTIQFTAYYPYAKSVDSVTGEGTEFKINNIGDLEMDFYLFIAFPEEGTKLELESIYLSKDKSTREILRFDNELEKQEEDSGIRINTKTNLIEGIDANGKVTGTLYNKHIHSGEFFKIPVGEYDLSVGGTNIDGSIEYQYIYY